MINMNVIGSAGSDECWQALTPEEKKLQLFLKQKATLDSFLERGAISQAQYDKSFKGMKEKMQISDKKRVKLWI